MKWISILILAALVPSPVAVSGHGGGLGRGPEGPGWSIPANGEGSGRGSGAPGWSLSLGASPAMAQTPDDDSRRDRMRTFLVLRISEALDLPEEKALQISKVLRDGDDKRRDLVAQRREVERSLRSAIERPGKQDAEAISKLIVQGNEIDSQIAMIPEASFRQVQGLLTVEQQARLVLLRPELKAQIRRSVERRLRERGARGP